MQPKILYIMSSYNLYGGTPKKTLDLMKYFKEKSVLYVYHSTFPQLKSEFEATKGKIYEGFYDRNIVLHLRKLLKIVDNEKIDIIQTQFSMGEILGFLIKLFRPKVKLVVTFVSAIKPSKTKSPIVGLIYHKVDTFIYISKFVYKKKIKQFPFLVKKKGSIIYNGTEERFDNGTTIPIIKGQSILCVGALIKLKNIQILIEALDILIYQKGERDIHLYLAGEGIYKPILERQIKEKKLESFVHFLGNQSNIGGLLERATVFAHPSFNEGFGLSVAEAMHARKPIIVSNAGALPELIDDKISGLVVEPHDAEGWADAILNLLSDTKIAKSYSDQAKLKAANEFSVKKFTKSYEFFYQDIFQESK